jgi:flagellar hook-length control protein FliK
LAASVAGEAASAVQPSTPAAPAPATTAAPPPLAGQVARPLFTLATAGPGEHVLSISVTPDDLGPVVVRAVITQAGIRMELFAPTDLARDALRLILPELRRDLLGGGLPATLDLSFRSQPGDTGSSSRQDRQPADTFAQSGAGFGDGPRGGAGQSRQSAAGQGWLHPAPVGPESATATTGPMPDDARPAAGLTGRRVDVLA